MNRNLSRLQTSMRILHINGPRHIPVKRFVTYIRRWRTITWLLVWVARNLVTRLWLLAWRYGNLVVTNLDRNGWNTSSRSDFTIRNVLTGDNVITGWSSWRNRN